MYASSVNGMCFPRLAEGGEANPQVSVVKDGIIIPHEGFSQDPELDIRIGDHASDAVARAVRVWAKAETGCRHRKRLATDVKCNAWEVCRAREGIDACSESGRGVLGSWDVIIECLHTGGRTEDGARALFKVY